MPNVAITAAGQTWPTEDPTHIVEDRNGTLVWARITAETTPVDLSGELAPLTARVTTLEGYNPDTRLTTLEGYNPDTRLTTLEGHNAGTRLTTLEGYNPDTRLTTLEGYNPDTRLATLEAHVQYEPKTWPPVDAAGELPNTAEFDALMPPVTGGGATLPGDIVIVSNVGIESESEIAYADGEWLAYRRADDTVAWGYGSPTTEPRVSELEALTHQHLRVLYDGNDPQSMAGNRHERVTLQVGQHFYNFNWLDGPRDTLPLTTSRDKWRLLHLEGDIDWIPEIGHMIRKGHRVRLSDDSTWRAKRDPVAGEFTANPSDPAYAALWEPVS